MITRVGSNRRPITIVTGGSRGIGAATAVHLARSGHDVVVNYRRNQEGAERVVHDVEAAGARAVAVQADVAVEADVERLFASAQQAFGPATGLVNNAGATLHLGDLAETPSPSSAR